jgi:predicted phage tail protein
MTTAAMQPLVQVRLHGQMGARFGRVHELAVETAAEAVHALCTQFPALRAWLRAFDGPGFRVRVGEGEHAQWRDEATVTLRLGHAQRVDIVPVIHGRKRNGWGQIILGAVVAVIGYFTSPYDGGSTLSAGISIMLGGAIALLTPMPKGSDSKAKDEGSRQLNGPPNITSPGGPVPLIIGRMLVGSVSVSAGLSTDQVLIQSSDPGAAELPYDEPADYNAGAGVGDGGSGGEGGDGDGAGDGGVGG